MRYFDFRSDLAYMFSQLALKSAFIRGSVVRFVHIPAGAVDTQLLEDATRRGESQKGGVQSSDRVEVQTDSSLCSF